MLRVRVALALVLGVVSASTAFAQVAPANPLWHEQKIKNYLPHKIGRAHV